MREDLIGRCKAFGEYIVSNNATIRQTAKAFLYSKSTVHIDVSKRLKSVDRHLFERVRIVLENNFEEKHIRGGIATKNKFDKLKNN